MKKMRRLAALGAIALLVPATAFADRTQYYYTVDLQADSTNLTARHHHKGTNGAIWDITLEDRDTGRTTVIPQVPALTYLWIAPASNVVVGLSNIKLRNPYQLVIYSANGERLLEQDMRAFAWARKTESVTNSIKWYRAPNPDVAIRQERNGCAVSVTDAGGVVREFPFSCPQGRGL